jgi:hypothetical protein
MSVQYRRSQSPMLGEGLSDGVSQRSGVCATIQSSTNYIYAGVCFSMVLAVIVLSVLLSEATTKLAHGALPPLRCPLREVAGSVLRRVRAASDPRAVARLARQLTTRTTSPAPSSPPATAAPAKSA